MELLYQEEILYKISDNQSLTKKEICASKLFNSINDIPEQWRSRKFEDFTNPVMKIISDKLIQWDFITPVISGIISSQNGIGKTHLATCIYKKYIFNQIEKSFDKTIENISEDYIADEIKNWFNRGSGGYEDIRTRMGMFLSEKKLALQIQESFNNKSSSQLEILESYCKTDFLVIDDLFSLKQNEFARQNIFYIIDERSDWHSKPTFITSNLSLSEIADIDTRIADRIRNSMLFQVTEKVESFRKSR